MIIANNNFDDGKYAVISYSRGAVDALESELRLYNAEGIRYWYDASMERGKHYEIQFKDALNHSNCTGVIFFITDSFFFSAPCFRELQYFENEYGTNCPSKFFLYVIPKGFELKEGKEKELLKRLKKYAEDNSSLPSLKIYNEMDEDEKIMTLVNRVNNFYRITQSGKILHGKMHRGDDYVKAECAKGKLFDMAGITTDKAIKEKEECIYGYFPQNKERGEYTYIQHKEVERPFDKALAYYAPIEWLILSETAEKKALLSKKLLFTVEYLELLYPTQHQKKPFSDVLKHAFVSLFRPSENNDFGEVEEVRFISQDELGSLLKYYTDEPQKKEILSPEHTFYSQVSISENAPSYWLAGDVNDARRIDVATEGLTVSKPGVETYFVRSVITVTKKLREKL